MKVSKKNIHSEASLLLHVVFQPTLKGSTSGSSFIGVALEMGVEVGLILLVIWKPTFASPQGLPPSSARSSLEWRWPSVMTMASQSWCSRQTGGPYSLSCPDSQWLPRSGPGLPSSIPSVGRSLHLSLPVPSSSPPLVMTGPRWWPLALPCSSSRASSTPWQCFRACSRLGA